MAKKRKSKKLNEGILNHPLGELVNGIQQPRMFEYKQHAGAPKIAMDGFMSGMENSAQTGFFAANSSFIGYHMCAMLATNWLIDKCCSVPARDAIRQGYSLQDDYETLRKTDKRYNVMGNIREMVHHGRIYGGRIILFQVAVSNPKEYYEAPFNIDGVGKGAYIGMSQLDPNWLTPELTKSDLEDPASESFYTPTYWRVKDRLIHKSHLHIFIPNPVPDYLKPTFRYLGIPTTQLIMDRVYAAERSANEAPQLLMTKRLTSLQVSTAALANKGSLEKNIMDWMRLRDNYGVKINGPDENIQQFDTTLSDVDTVLMSQYQLVAAAANIPATKLLGTQPKGFAGTGEYERSVYREFLESIQTNDITPLLERHYELVAKSLGLEFNDPPSVQWAPLDSPSNLDWATLEKVKAERDNLLVQAGAIDSEDIRERIRLDKENDYYGIEKGDFSGQENYQIDGGQSQEGTGIKLPSFCQGALQEDTPIIDK